MTEWEIKKAKYPSQTTSTEEDEEYRNLIVGGWEPFSVQHILENDKDYEHDMIWFRRLS